MSQKKNEFDVAIIGAGIAGLALANALDNSGLKVVLLEAGKFKGRPETDGDINGYDMRVSALSLRSIQFLQNLGAWYTVESLRSQAFDHMYVWDGEGTGKLAFSASEVSAEVLGHIVENRILVHSLLDNLSMSSNVKLIDDAHFRTIQAITERDGSKHNIILAQTNIIAKLVVGADGAQSFVRKHYGVKTREWDYGHNAIVCTVKTEKPQDNTAWQRFMQTGLIALLPLQHESQQYCSVVWSAETTTVEDIMQLDNAQFCQQLTQATESILGNIEQASARFSIPLRQRHAINYVQHGVALVADAAHTIHPLAGLGINMSLQDVRVLAEELLRAQANGRDLADVCVLSRYQRRRKGENLLVMSAMEGFKRLFEQKSLPLLWLRNKGMSGVGQFSLLKRRVIKQVMGL